MDALGTVARHSLTRLTVAAFCFVAPACSSASVAVVDAGPSDLGVDVPPVDTGTDLGMPMDVTDVVVTDMPVPVDSGPVGCTLFGSFLGAPLDEMDCLSSVSTTPEGVFTDIVIVDYTGACSVYAMGASQANSRVVDLHFSGSPVMPRTYEVVTDPLDVRFVNLDDMCNVPSGESASTGTVTITRVDALGIAGSFDVMLNADHVTGTFNAPKCVALASDAGSICVGS